MIKKLLLISAMLAGSGMLTANAAPVLSFSPSSQAVALGNQVSVSAVLSGLEAGGLNEALTAFDITVSFDSSILSASTPSVLTTPFGSSPILNTSVASGQVQWSLVSLETDAFLQALQGDSVTLGTLTFNTLTIGISPLTFSYNDLTGVGGGFLEHSLDVGSINVVRFIPEPAAIILIALGALGIAGEKRRKSKLEQSCAING